MKSPIWLLKRARYAEQMCRRFKKPLSLQYLDYRYWQCRRAGFNPEVEEIWNWWVALHPGIRRELIKWEVTPKFSDAPPWMDGWKRRRLPRIRKMSARTRRLAKRLGLRPAELRVCVAVVECSNQGTAAKQLGMQRPYVNRVIGKVCDKLPQLISILKPHLAMRADVIHGAERLAETRDVPAELVA